MSGAVAAGSFRVTQGPLGLLLARQRQLTIFGLAFVALTVVMGAGATR